MILPVAWLEVVMTTSSRDDNIGDNIAILIFPVLDMT